MPPPGLPILLDGETKAKGSLVVLAVAVVGRGLIHMGIRLDRYRTAVGKFRTVGDAHRRKRGQHIRLVGAIGLAIDAAAHSGHCFAIEFFGQGQVFDHQGCHVSFPVK